MVAGDNSLGQLWDSSQIVSPKFIQPTNFPYEGKIHQISSVSAYNQSIAFLISETDICFKEENKEIAVFRPGLVRKIQCFDSTVFALLADGTILNCREKITFQGKNYKDLAFSKMFQVAINSSNEAVVFSSKPTSAPVVLCKNAISIGCTDSEIYICTKDGVFVYTEGGLQKIDSTEQIVQVVCSDAESLFLDEKGGLWRVEYNHLIRIYGIPPIVFVSVGFQHFAAISNDGLLFMWGFNPSGQLGIGNDKPSNDPIQVLENARLVACGTHSTFVICGAHPFIPDCLKVQNPKGHIKECGRISRAEHI